MASIHSASAIAAPQEDFNPIVPERKYPEISAEEYVKQASTEGADLKALKDATCRVYISTLEGAQAIVDVIKVDENVPAHLIHLRKIYLIHEVLTRVRPRQTTTWDEVSQTGIQSELTEDQQRMLNEFSSISDQLYKLSPRTSTILANRLYELNHNLDEAQSKVNKGNLFAQEQFFRNLYTPQYGGMAHFAPSAVTKEHHEMLLNIASKGSAEAYRYLAVYYSYLTQQIFENVSDFENRSKKPIMKKYQEAKLECLQRAAKIDSTFYADVASLYWNEMRDIDDRAARKSVICLRRAVVGLRLKDENLLIWNTPIHQSLFEKFKNILEFPSSPNFVQILKSIGGPDLLAYHVAMLNDSKFLQNEIAKDVLDDKQIKIIITGLCAPEESELIGNDQVFSHLLTILKKNESYLDLILKSMSAEQKFDFAAFVRAKGSWLELAETILSAIQADEITDLETKLTIHMEVIRAKFYTQLTDVADLDQYICEPAGREHYRALYREYKPEFNKWLLDYIALKRDGSVEIDALKQAEFESFAKGWHEIQMRNNMLKKAEAKHAKAQFADLFSRMKFCVDQPDPRSAAADAAAKRAESEAGKTEDDA